MKYNEIIHIWTAVVDESEERSSFSNSSNWKEEAWKNHGFNGIRTCDLCDTGATLYQLSYEATHRERGQFIDFISPARSEMMWSRYEIIHIWTAVVYVIFQFIKQLERRRLISSGPSVVLPRQTVACNYELHLSGFLKAIRSIRSEIKSFFIKLYAIDKWR